MWDRGDEHSENNKQKCYTTEPTIHLKRLLGPHIRSRNTYILRELNLYNPERQVNTIQNTCK